MDFSEVAVLSQGSGVRMGGWVNLFITVFNKDIPQVNCCGDVSYHRHSHPLQRT